MSQTEGKREHQLLLSILKEYGKGMNNSINNFFSNLIETQDFKSIIILLGHLQTCLTERDFKSESAYRFP